MVGRGGLPVLEGEVEILYLKASYGLEGSALPIALPSIGKGLWNTRYSGRGSSSDHNILWR